MVKSNRVNVLEVSIDGVVFKCRTSTTCDEELLDDLLRWLEEVDAPLPQVSNSEYIPPEH